jgi:predicted RecA/RadA family phage recombinase
VIAAGAVVVIGARIGVSLNAIAVGATGPIAVVGAYKLTKKSGDTFVQGALVYWDATNQYITSTTTSNTLGGYAVAAAASADATITVKLNA